MTFVITMETNDFKMSKKTCVPSESEHSSSRLVALRTWNPSQQAPTVHTTSMQPVYKDLRYARACLCCSLIKTVDQFENDGCENCDFFLNMKNNRHRVYEYTSANYDGVIAAICPEESWVCKWQRTNKFVRGIYAVSVSGMLPVSMVKEMTKRGITYKSRDKNN